MVRLSASERRTQILRTASALAVVGGLEAVTHRAIAAEIGAGPGLIARYAQDIDALRADVFTAVVGAETDDLFALLESADSAVASLRLLIDRLAAPGRESRASLWLDGWSRGRRSPVIAAAVVEQMDRWQAEMSSVLERGSAVGEFDLDDADACAWELIALLDGLSAHSTVSYRRTADHAAILAAPLECRLGLERGSLLNHPPRGAHHGS